MQADPCLLPGGFHAGEAEYLLLVGVAVDGSKVTAHPRARDLGHALRGALAFVFRGDKGERGRAAVGGGETTQVSFLLDAAVVVPRVSLAAGGGAAILQALAGGAVGLVAHPDAPLSDVEGAAGWSQVGAIRAEPVVGFALRPVREVRLRPILSTTISLTS